MPNPIFSSAFFPKKGEEVPTHRVLDICTFMSLHDLRGKIEADPPAIPFVSDGCSVWPDEWITGQSFYIWCFCHDIAYWAGQPGDELGRLEADAWLMLKVAKHVSVKLAEKMFAGVRIGGAEWLPTPWRWGYGRSESTPSIKGK